ncbi:UDP-glucose 4-epimerase GalE [Methylomonas koyamae]|uniref:UDP-glucose 4-epimerase n=1 Tax=Methylomonas koyamae TaxID=702114 RepID=A0A291IKX6_9GAMM|nr:UDP-glucose 4-epimerase GalE [Methylomonas koyamae]ATG90861.1 UDP-galactose-4-epimerase [Methylomonas koyamae]OAI24290.1 UDP-glucose 4-epimerase [Methylomonas koyamae]
MTQTILVTGGTGYIGSHTCVELLDNGFDIVIVDNLSNSKIEALRRIETITGKAPLFYQADITDAAALARIFQNHSIDAVVHFAGLKAVGESCQQPLSYYRNNIYGTQVLLETMAEAGVKRLVFSSSATVYGDPHTVPILESFPLQATNPYGRTKLFIEEILRDAGNADRLNQSANPWQTAILRYFNPIGAHSSGLIGEDPNGIPNNLMPYLSQVAIGKLPMLSIFGDDYPTVDGTGVRDYIHVVDLAQGHIKALQYLLSQPANAAVCDAVNLGTGNGYSVLQMVNTFIQVTGQDVPYKIAPRRAGDVAACYADPSLAQQKLGWKAERDLTQMIADTWRWQSRNPNGYH